MNIEQERAELLPCPFCGGSPEIVDRDVEPQGDPWYGHKFEKFVECECGACLFDETFHEGFYSDEKAVEAWNRRAALQSQPIPLLAKKHTGMMVDYTGLIGQVRAALKHGEKSLALAEMLHQLARHIKELGEGWYSGDTSVVDEFLQLYCVEDDARRRIEAEGK